MLGLAAGAAAEPALAGWWGAPVGLSRPPWPAPALVGSWAAAPVWYRRAAPGGLAGPRASAHFGVPSMPWMGSAPRPMAWAMRNAPLWPPRQGPGPWFRQGYYGPGPIVVAAPAGRWPSYAYPYGARQLADRPPAIPRPGWTGYPAPPVGPSGRWGVPMWAARPAWAPPVAYRPVQRGYVGLAWQARAGMRSSSGAWAYPSPAPRFVGRWTAPTPRWSGVIPSRPSFRPAARSLAPVAAPMLVQGSWPRRSLRPGTYRFRPLRVGDLPLVIRLPAVPVLEPRPPVAPEASGSAGGHAAIVYTSPTWRRPARVLDALTGTAGSRWPAPVSRVSGALAFGDPQTHLHRWATLMVALGPIRPGVVSPQPAPRGVSGVPAAWAQRSASGAAYDRRTDWRGRGSAVALAVPRESSASDRRRPDPSG